MLVKIVSYIAKFFFSIFNVIKESSDAVLDASTQTKQQITSVKKETVEAFKLIVDPSTHINYFEVRAVGEFLRAVALVIRYEYDNKLGYWIAYLIRHKNKHTTEYIKFSKQNESDDICTITYTTINKTLSKKGVTTDIGTTSDDNLSLSRQVINMLYDSLSYRKAPLYLTHYINDNIYVEDKMFLYDCWVLVNQIIENKVQSFLSGTDSSLTDDIDNFSRKAGAHYFMSFFNCFTNGYYYLQFQNTVKYDIVDTIKKYNEVPFHKNKIVSLSYNEKERGIAGRLEYNADDKTTTLINHGMIVVVTGMVNNIENVNYSISQFLFKNGDKELSKAYLFFLLSTSSLDNTKVFYDNISGSVKPSSVSDVVAEIMNEEVTKVIASDMESLSFKSNANNEFESTEFEEMVDATVKLRLASNDMSLPELKEPIAITKVAEPKKEEEAPLNAIEVLKNEEALLNGLSIQELSEYVSKPDTIPKGITLDSVKRKIMQILGTS